MNPPLRAAHHPECYPSDPERALAYFRTIVDSGAAPVRTQPLGGIVAPHIDFRVEKRLYGAAFRPLLEVPLAEAYLILGVGHRSRREWNFDRRNYETPLGEAICADDWLDELSGNDGRLFEGAAHQGEHSIEFALIWLQAIHRLHPAGGARPVRFVPLLCGGLHHYLMGAVEWDEMEDFHRLSAALGKVLRGKGADGKLRVIVSIDGCHIGPRFDHPFAVTPQFLEETARWEDRLWANVAMGDARAFLEWLREEGNDRYFDGVGALALLLAAGEGKISVTRTAYEQWFTEHDASAVTFSSGVVSIRG